MRKRLIANEGARTVVAMMLVGGFFGLLAWIAIAFLGGKLNPWSVAVFAAGAYAMGRRDGRAAPRDDLDA